MDERRRDEGAGDEAATPAAAPADEATRPDERGDASHRFAADEEVADGAAGADEARTPGMGA